MILRIIDKQTHLFLRDDFTFDEKTEIGLDTEPSQGLYAPKWDGTQWVETGQAPEPVPQEQTIEERLAQTEELLQSVTMAFNNILQAIEKGDLIDE